jgi:hypothetical protein
MNPLLIPPLIEAGRALIDRMFPDPVAQSAERQRAQMELLQMAQADNLAQIEVNKIEAGTGDRYIGGWRPGAGWVCVIGLGYTFLAQPLLSWIALIQGWPVPPAIDIEALMILLGGLLGLSGFRSVEKVKGVAAG